MTKFDFENILKAYTSTSSRINMKYEFEFDRISEEGMKILEEMAEKYNPSKPPKIYTV